MLALHGDAPFCRRKRCAGEMEEDRASPASGTRHQVVVEHGDHVVEMIVAPERLRTRRIGQSDLAIVIPVVWRVAPPEVPPYRLNVERCSRAAHSVGTIVNLHARPCAQWSCSVALLFLRSHSTLSKSYGKM